MSNPKLRRYALLVFATVYAAATVAFLVSMSQENNTNAILAGLLATGWFGLWLIETQQHQRHHDHAPQHAQADTEPEQETDQ